MNGVLWISHAFTVVGHWVGHHGFMAEMWEALKMINSFSTANVLPVQTQIARLLGLFEQEYEFIGSEFHPGQKKLDVLAELSDGLLQMGFVVRQGARKPKNLGLELGSSGNLVLDVDAFHPDYAIALIVLAGRGVMNNEFHRAVLLATMSTTLTVLVVAIRNYYKPTNSHDYEEMVTLIKSLKDVGNVLPANLELLLVGY